VLAVEILGWVGSALLVYSVLQTRILRLRLFNGVASALLVIFNAAIAVWPMVALNVTLTAINVFYIVRLLPGRHDPQTFEVVQISPSEAYLKHLLHDFDADNSTLQPWILSRRRRSHRSRLPHPHRSGDGRPGAGQKRR
jgi:hypothetical protein